VVVDPSEGTQVVCSTPAKGSMLPSSEPEVQNGDSHLGVGRFSSS